jgi:hypothetical protein
MYGFKMMGEAAAGALEAQFSRRAGSPWKISAASRPTAAAAAALPP